MGIPEFQTFMLPVLELAGDGKEHSLAEAREKLAQRFKLTEEERNELLPSGRQRRFDNRVTWAKVYLEHAGLLSSLRRGHFAITDRGRALLLENPSRIDIHFLE
jgi:restriction system protein